MPRFCRNLLVLGLWGPLVVAGQGPGWQPVVTADSTLQFAVPATWHLSESLRQKGILALYAPAEGPGDPYRENLTVSVTRLTPTELAALADARARTRRSRPAYNDLSDGWVNTLVLAPQVWQGLAKSYAQGTVRGPERAFLSGQLALRYAVTYTQAGLPLQSVVLLTVYRGQVYHITLTAHAPVATEWQDLLGRVEQTLALH